MKDWKAATGNWTKKLTKKQVAQKYAPPNTRTEDQIKSDWDLL